MITLGQAGLPFGPGGRVPPAERRSAALSLAIGVGSSAIAIGSGVPIPLPLRPSFFCRSRRASQVSSGLPVVEVPGDRGRQQPRAARPARAGRRG